MLIEPNMRVILSPACYCLLPTRKWTTELRLVSKHRAAPDDMYLADAYFLFGTACAGDLVEIVEEMLADTDRAQDYLQSRVSSGLTCLISASAFGNYKTLDKTLDVMSRSPGWRWRKAKCVVVGLFWGSSRLCTHARIRSSSLGTWFDNRSDKRAHEVDAKE